jgi:glycosyltransferase involved in cell wall biosynthesis
MGDPAPAHAIQSGAQLTRFSVVVPAYNAERTVTATIRSVLRQTERDVQLIVVDDGSSDRTPSLVEELASGDPRLELVRQPNQGTAATRNTGIALAVAPYISFLDNDDLWLPNYLEEMGAALDARPDAAFAYCDAWSFLDETMAVRRRTELELRPGPPVNATREEVLLTLAKRNFVMSSATIRASALAGTPAFEADVTGTDDYLLWFRLLLTGGTAVRGGNEPLLLQRDRGDSQSKDERFMTEGLVRVLTRAAADPRLDDEARAVLLARAGEAEAQLASPSRRAGLRARLARAADLLVPNRTFLRHPPAQVVAAFPEFRVQPQGGRPIGR